MNPVLENYDVEIDYQAHSPTADPEIGQQLRIVDRRESFNRFYFYCDNATHQNIHSISTLKSDAFVFQGQGSFVLKRNSSQD